MIVGTHTAETTQDKINIVLRAGRELDFSLRMKAERMRNRQYDVLGTIEKIVFEADRDSSIADLRSIGADVTGRCLYWPDHGPAIARTKPEQDLIFTQHLRLPLPHVPDPRSIVNNPYLVDQWGKSQLKNIEDLEKPRAHKQRLEQIASSKCGRFLVFHPVAEIDCIMLAPDQKTGRLGLQFGVIGDRRMPLSSLTGFDRKKMALLVDPYTGEAYFTGGRYQMPGPDLKG